MKPKTFFIIFAIALVIFIAVKSCSSDGHAPGYGNTSKCTICGKSATHQSDNYGFCDTHWKKAISG